MIEAKISEICRHFHQKNFLASADGNMSVRNGNRIQITPSGINKSHLKEGDLCEMDLEGRILSGSPSSERLMHLEIYRRCPKAQAVVHAHPPSVIAWTIAHPEDKEIPNGAISEVILAVGSLPIVPYARPGTPEMGTTLAPFLPKHRVLILARHGAVSWGENLDEAANGIERAEHATLVLLKALQMGKITLLSEEEIQFLQSKRKEIGEKTL